MMFFTELEQDMILDTYKYVDEILVDTRKGVAMSKYIIQLPEESTWYNWKTDEMDEPLPENLIGYWMMAWSEDLEENSEKDCIKKSAWVKVHQVEVKITKWEAV